MSSDALRSLLEAARRDAELRDILGWQKGSIPSIHEDRFEVLLSTATFLRFHSAYRPTIGTITSEAKASGVD